MRSVHSALDGGLGVAVAGQPLHVDVVRRQRVAARVGVVDAGRVREPLRERRLLAQRLGQRRVGQRAARVQPLPERVHHADLRQAHQSAPEPRELPDALTHARARSGTCEHFHQQRSTYSE